MGLNNKERGNEMEIKIEREIDGLKISIESMKKVVDKKAYADGLNLRLGLETCESTMISIQKNGKKAVCKDINFFCKLDPVLDKTFIKRNPKAYARFGDSYIGEDIFNAITSVMDEVNARFDSEIDDNFNTVKADENTKHDAGMRNLDDISRREAERAAHPGWCEKCHSYCYGDCTAN